MRFLIDWQIILNMKVKYGLQGLFIGFESINSSSIDNVHKIQNQANLTFTLQNPC